MYRLVIRVKIFFFTIGPFARYQDGLRRRRWDRNEKITKRRSHYTSGSRRRTMTCSFWTVLPDRRSGRKPRRPAPSRRTTGAGGTTGVWTTALPGRLPDRPGHRRQCWRPRRTSQSSGTADRSHRRRARATTTRPTSGRHRRRRRPTTVPCARPRPAWRTPAWSRRTTPTSPAWAPPGWFASSSRRPSASAIVWTSNADGPWPKLGLPWRLYIHTHMHIKYVHTDTALRNNLLCVGRSEQNQTKKSNNNHDIAVYRRIRVNA